MVDYEPRPVPPHVDHVAHLARFGHSYPRWNTMRREITRNKGTIFMPKDTTQWVTKVDYGGADEKWPNLHVRVVVWFGIRFDVIIHRFQPKESRRIGAPKVSPVVVGARLVGGRGHIGDSGAVPAVLGITGWGWDKLPGVVLWSERIDRRKSLDTRRSTVV